MNQKIKLIALDMDGTLLLDDHYSISERTRRALRAALERGIEIVPATGRAHAVLPEALMTIPGIHYAITANGAVVQDMQTGDVLYKNFISVEIVQELFRLLEPYDLFIQLYSGGMVYTQEKDRETAANVPFPKKLLENVLEKLQYVPDFASFLMEHPEGIEKFNIPHLPPQFRTEILEKVRTVQGVCGTTSIKDNLELNAESCNKGAALRFLTKQLGMTPEEVLVMGDNGNDLEMLAFTPNSYAMQNGTDAAKKAAQLVAPSNEEDGVAQVIEKLLLK